MPRDYRHICKSPQITDTEKYLGLVIVIFASNLRVTKTKVGSPVRAQMGGQKYGHDQVHYLSALWSMINWKHVFLLAFFLFSFQDSQWSLL